MQPQPLPRKQGQGQRRQSVRPRRPLQRRRQPSHVRRPRGRQPLRSVMRPQPKLAGRASVQLSQRRLQRWHKQRRRLQWRQLRWRWSGQGQHAPPRPIAPQPQRVPQQWRRLTRTRRKARQEPCRWRTMHWMPHWSAPLRRLTCSLKPVLHCMSGQRCWATNCALCAVLKRGATARFMVAPASTSLMSLLAWWSRRQCQRSRTKRNGALVECECEEMSAGQ
mmetsp:Transcript_15351/g.30818  ORF Transcript_15351/g.30818 Transcript_15351/m.30818 type:complete len:221 (-) Transcript_15351:183-845(-)